MKFILYLQFCLMQAPQRWICFCLLLAVSFSRTALAFDGVAVRKDLEERGATLYYDWKPVRTGAGGFVTGVHLGSNNGQPFLARTDVGGCYRYDFTTDQWINILGNHNLPTTDPTLLGGTGGSLAIVSATTDPSRIYMAFGVTSTSIYKSEDTGDTWSFTSLLNLPEGSNGNGRLNGFRLAVDPFDEDIVLYGSISSGLFLTTNGGSTWTNLTMNGAIPSSNENTYGVVAVVFNPAHGTIFDAALGKNRCKVAYAAVWQVGIFQSRDGGNTWNKVSRGSSGNAQIPADNGTVTHLVLGPADGKLFVGDSSAGFYSFAFNDTRNSGTWKFFAPSTSATWFAIAVSPTDSNLLLVFDVGGRAWRSTDGGLSFSSELALYRNATGDIPWLSWTDEYYMTTADILFDPVVPNRLWFAEGLGVWYADGVNTGTQLIWHSRSVGIEELVSNTAVHPPGGNLVTGHWDRAVFFHEDLDVFPATHGVTSRFGSGWDFAYSAQNPEFLVANIYDHRQCCGTPASPDNQAAYSINGGRNWTTFAGIATGQWPSTYKFGNIAVAAIDTNNIVVLPTNNLAPMYSTDRGVTWTITSLPYNDGTPGSHPYYYTWRSVVAADNVLDHTFYILHTATNRVYMSTDGGATWKNTTSAGILPNSGVQAKLRAHPSIAGLLTLSYGTVGGLAYGMLISTDFGESWTELPGLRSVWNYAWGAPLPGSDNYTLYAQGKNVSNPLNSYPGIYCSLDNGNTWGKLVDFPISITSVAQAMAADMSTFGRVSVGFTGNGFAYGQLNPNAPDIPSTFCTPAWDSGLTFEGPTTTSASTASSLWNPLQSLFF